MIHLDLFSGVGGFAYAADQVWENVEHIFCDNDAFCQQVLEKHWPEAPIFGDIRTLTKDTFSDGRFHGEQKEQANIGNERNTGTGDEPGVYLLTGGFPCQPFSQAGRRKGTADDRYLWPEMLRVIREFRPRWVIGENVAGLVTWSNGLVLEQVCSDLEKEGYEVQPFIIPAVSVNAPHRRDRVWIVAHSESGGTRSGEQERSSTRKSKAEIGNGNSDAPDTDIGQGGSTDESKPGTKALEESSPDSRSWDENWLEVATEFCGVDDGLPVELDGFKLTKAGHRVQQLKAYGNAIVPQVAIEIMKAIKEVDLR